MNKGNVMNIHDGLLKCVVNQWGGGNNLMGVVGEGSSLFLSFLGGGRLGLGEEIFT